jgi:hypothetical protein
MYTCAHKKYKILVRFNLCVPYLGLVLFPIQSLLMKQGKVSIRTDTTRVERKKLFPKEFMRCLTSSVAFVSSPYTIYI